MQVKYKGPEKESDVVTRIVRDSDLKEIVKSISRGESASRISKNVYKSPSLKEDIQNCVLKDIKSDCVKLCSDKMNCILRHSNSAHLASFSIEKMKIQLQTETPLLYKTMSSICQKEIGKVITAAVGLQIRRCLPYTIL